MLLASARCLRHCTEAAEVDTEAKELPAVVTAADAVPAEAHALVRIVHMCLITLLAGSEHTGSSCPCQGGDCRGPRH